MGFGGPGPPFCATICEPLRAVALCCPTKLCPALLDLKLVGGGCHLLSFITDTSMV